MDANKFAIRAGAGYRPVLQGPSTRVGNANDWIALNADEVTLDGIDLVYLTGQPQYVLRGFRGNATLTNCRLHQNPSAGSTLITWTGDKIMLKDCLISGTRPLGLGPTTNATFINNLIVIPDTSPLFDFRGVYPGAISVNMLQNTIVGPRLLSLFDFSVKQPLKFESKANLFLGELAIVTVGTKGEPRDLVNWKEDSNLAVDAFHRIGKEGGKFPINSLAAWSDYWKLKSNPKEASKFEFPWGVVKPGGQSWQEALQTTQRHFSFLAAQGKLDPAKVGPKWDILGPGKPYTTYLQSKGVKPIDHDPSEGRFLLLRKGTKVKAFGPVNEALSASESGDEIEMFSNDIIGPITYESKDGKRISMKAALGYQPRIDRFGLAPKDEASVAGIEVTGQASGHLDGGPGSLSKVSNCAIGAAAGWLFRVPDVSGSDKAAIIENCIFGPQSGHIFLPKDGSLTFRNCLVFTTEGVGPLIVCAGGKCQLRFENCALHTPIHCGADKESASLEIIYQSNVIGPSFRFHINPQGKLTLLDSPESKDNIILQFAQPGVTYPKGSVFLGPPQWDPQAWRLLPMSPGYRAGPDGKDFGADVDRIGRVTPGR